MKSFAPSTSSTVLLVRGRWVAPLHERIMALTRRRTKDGGVAISREVDGDTDQTRSGIKRADWSSPYSMTFPHLPNLTDICTVVVG